MGHRCCCVANCKNNELKSTCKFYKFPAALYKLEQRKKWIAAVRKVNPPEWELKPSHVICSDHFVGKKRSNEEISPAYIPSIFSASGAKKIDETAAVNRHMRFMKRRIGQTKQKSRTISTNQDQHIEENPTLNFIKVELDIPEYLHKGTQANTFIDASEPEKSFICNRYITNGPTCDAQVQTDIILVSPRIESTKRKKNSVT